MTVVYALGYAKEVTHEVPDDEAFLEVVVASGAEYLVTGNLVHFPHEVRAGVSVVSPAVFLEAYRTAIG